MLRDLDRWEERGFEGLADGTAPGNPPLVAGEVRAFVEERLSEERTWNATQLAQAVDERVSGSRRRRRPCAPAPGVHGLLSWKRTRYVPPKPADPEEEREAREELEALRKGLRRVGPS